MSVEISRVITDGVGHAVIDIPFDLDDEIYAWEHSKLKTFLEYHYCELLEGPAELLFNVPHLYSGVCSLRMPIRVE